MSSKPPRRRPPPTSPSPTSPPPQAERLQKLLAAAGLGSRRAIEGWIAAGRVSVDGKVAILGTRALPGASITVDGKPVVLKDAGQWPRVLQYHKPVGEMVTRSDPGGRPTVFERLPEGRWVAVGRLDINSSGLLLLTDSGELANQLMHPRYGFEREYEVRVHGGLDAQAQARLLSGVELEDGVARFSRLQEVRGESSKGTNRWYRAVLGEGRNREVRRMVEAVGVQVSRLVRVRFGPISLSKDLPPGHWRELDAELVERLLRSGQKTP